MADRDGTVVDSEYDYDYDDPSRTVGELVSRLRFCFRDSYLAKVESVLTARENKMKEEIVAFERENQRLKNELEKLDLDKRKAESEAESWKTKYKLLESRLSLLESYGEQLMSKKAAVRVSGENGRNGESVELENEVVDVDAVDAEEHVGIAAALARNAGLARGGSGRTTTRNLVEIIDSDDEVAAPEGSLSGNESTSQGFANSANPDQTSSQNATEMLKRKLDSSLGVSTDNDNNDGANVGDTLTGDCHRNKLQKFSHVYDGSPDNHGLATDKNADSSLGVSTDNDNNDGANLGDTLTGDCHRNKLQKVTHVHDGSPDDHGSATDENVDSSLLGATENDNNDRANVGDTLTGDCHRNKLLKVTHVHDGSPDNDGLATDKNVDTCFTPSSHFPVTLRHCEKKMGTEHATRNLMSEFLSNGHDGFLSEDSSSSSSSSDSESDDGLNTTFDFSQLIRKQPDDKEWEYEVEVMTSLVKDDELCLKAVCALYRQQISLGTSPRNMLSCSSRGFDHVNVLRGITLAKFLIDGDPQGRLKKSVSELLQFDRRALEDCRRIAMDHCKQLLEIHKKKEDPLFQP